MAHRISPILSLSCSAGENIFTGEAERRGESKVALSLINKVRVETTVKTTRSETSTSESVALL